MNHAIAVLRQQPERLSKDIICPHRLRLLENLLTPLFATPEPVRNPSSSVAVPPTWHLIFGKTDSRNTMPGNKHLSDDGYEKWQALDPAQTGFKYRVWAGSSYRFNPDNPLRAGDRMVERSRVEDVQVKINQERGQETVFVTILKWVEEEKRADWVCEERRTLAYRQQPFQRIERQPANETVQSTDEYLTVTPDNLMLFQYSALTFNSHRIHYDLQYCREQEGFPGKKSLIIDQFTIILDLLVHGPLTSTLLLEYFRHRIQPANTILLSWQYRALFPLFVNQAIRLSGQLMRDGNDFNTTANYRLTARNEQGQICMQGTATIGGHQ
jgi:3-methylfumaryl-CoA hydratase